MTHYRVGTSGWHYDHWRGVLYPHDMPKREWFAHYAREFETVELNNSFYRQPAAATWRAWREAAPRGFCFSVKANPFLTHLKRFSETGESLTRFLDGARLLEGSLGPVLYQAPPTFKRSEANVQRLEAFLTALPTSTRHVFEFRDSSWFTDETLDTLRRHGVAFCIHDMSGLRCPVEATADFVYLRMHGPGGAYAGSHDEKAPTDRVRTLDGLTGGSIREQDYPQRDSDRVAQFPASSPGGDGCCCAGRCGGPDCYGCTGAAADRRSPDTPRAL